MTDPTPTRDEAVPTGWKLVPVEPTPEMMASGERAWMNRDLSRPDSNPISDCYRAMLASAPAPASGRVDAVAERMLREAVEAAKVAEVCAALATRYTEKGNAEGANWKPQVSYRVAAAYEAHLKRIADALAALSPAATPVSEAEPVAWRWRNADGPWHVSLVNPHEGRYDKLEHRPLYEALAKPASSPAGEQEALRALYEWYDRDGSVGGASEVFEEHRAALSQSTSAGRVGE